MGGIQTVIASLLLVVIQVDKGVSLECLRCHEGFENLETRMSISPLYGPFHKCADYEAPIHCRDEAANCYKFFYSQLLDNSDKAFVQIWRMCSDDSDAEEALKAVTALDGMKHWSSLQELDHDDCSSDSEGGVRLTNGTKVDIEAAYCSCGTDVCNSSGRLHVKIGLLITALAKLFLL